MTNLVMVDSPQCWATAFSMMIYTFFAMAVLKSSSVLYVGSMEMLDLTREQASWPATLVLMLSQLAGKPKWNSHAMKLSAMKKAIEREASDSSENLFVAGPVYGMMLKHTSERFCLILGALLCSVPMMVAAVWATEVVTLCGLVGVVLGEFFRMHDYHHCRQSLFRRTMDARITFRDPPRTRIPMERKIH